MRLRRRADALNGQDGSALQAADLDGAGRFVFAVDQDGACPALSLAAAKTCAQQPEAVAQDIEQDRRRLGVDPAKLAIDGKFDHRLARLQNKRDGPYRDRSRRATTERQPPSSSDAAGRRRAPLQKLPAETGSVLCRSRIAVIPALSALALLV